ncbi:MAG TPA: SusC/RagA family TonB-linked outer membrane protein [Chryseosolibacter sp.]|nr:SusC/RagA family TonB-linked outer membrane protein [Chryseosolibacter sp.]
MMKRYFTVLTLLTALTIAGMGVAFAQDEELETFASVVTDADGNPIPNAEVFSGNAYAKTDADGRFSIEITPGANLTIEADGFENRTIDSDEITFRNGIKVQAEKFLYGTTDEVHVAFGTSKKGNIVGAVSTVDPVETGTFDNNIWASDVITGRTPGMLGDDNVRGLGIGIDVASLTGSGRGSGNALFIVDGLPRDITFIRASEIESITVLKDVNAAMLYGSAAVNGVVLLTTKRGETFRNTSDISFNYGVSTPRALPDYLGSADYMTWFNRARENDGLAPQFSDEMIQNFRTGNKYRYPDVDYYSSEYLRPYKSYFDLNAQFSGGNENAKFYANLGWNSSGGLLNFGEGADARNNSFNARGNIDLRVNDWIDASIDASGFFILNKGPQGNYWSSAANLRPHLYAPLLPIDLIDPENDLLRARKNDVDGLYLLGGNANQLTTPFGDGYAAGLLESVGRNFAFNNRVNFDLGRITQGLSFHTNISFDHFIGFNQTIDNDYSVYEAEWDDSTDVIVNLKQHGVDARPGTQIVGNTFFLRRLGFYGQLAYERNFGDVHEFSASLLGFGSNYKEQGDFQGLKQAHLGFQASYVYDRRYAVDFSSAYVNSVKLAEGHRGGFSPSLGLGWIMSSENFMSSADNVDFLKLRVSGGILNSDLPIGGFYYYDNRYATSGSYNWDEGTRSRSGVVSSWSSNPDLGYAKRKEINIGVEGYFFDRMIGIEADAYYDVYSDLVTRPNTTYPSFYTDFIPYENFGEDQYRGIEGALHFNKGFGDWRLSVDLNALYVTSEKTKVDEVYDNDYQFRQGRPVDATFGLEAVGLFQSQADIDNSPLQAFGDVKPGDIKYKDQNGDGIVDGNDEVYLRRWQAPFSAGAQLRLSYRNVTLFILGEGRTGSDSFMESNYYWVDGNDKYSEVVLNSWTPETSATATYPRLSSVTNSNNYRRSSFWLYNNDYFQIRRVQLSYDLPDHLTSRLRMKHLSVFVNATTPIQFAKNREVRDLNTGGEPYYRTFSLGLKSNF